MNHEEQLDLIAKAWGRRRAGDDTYYAFFPWIDREEQAEAGIRRAGYHEGPAFEWPVDRDKILDHMADHADHDLYWCPSLFEYPERLTEWAVDEKALWADLDEVDPRSLSEYQPTIAWQTSPGRYQALWLLNQGDIRGASWEGGENQRLTYSIGADESGWDTTQLLRIPGWKNHKLNYRKNGKAPLGKLLWKNGRRYQADDFDDLPTLDRPSITIDAVASDIDHTDRSKVMAKWRTRIPKRIRELLNAREPSGDRSDVLWDIERSLADIGCSVTEIVVLVRGSVWNKYDGRGDELKRLINEASKALAQRPEEITEALEEAQEDKGRPTRWNDHFANIKKPEMLVKGVLTKGKVGFIAGQPKSWKSWMALDLALSVSTGARYLDYFDVLEPGPVLYIQVEDDPSTVKSRGNKIWRGKKSDRVKLAPDGSVVWEPGTDLEFDPDIDVYMESGVTISEPEWQEWLADTLREGMDGRPYVLMILDTLMMVAGDVEENRAQEMTTKVFRPLKALSRDHGVAIQVVHHLRKGGDDEARGGQLMLGSVANHAWSEDSQYLRLTKTGGVKLEVESKFFPSEAYRVTGIDNSRGWSPAITPWTDARLDEAEVRALRKSPQKKTSLSEKQMEIYEIVDRLQPVTSLQVANAMGYEKTSFTQSNLKAIESKGAIKRTNERPMKWITA